MAKNKNKQPQPQQLSPEKYIRLKARNLPVYKCFVSTDWQERGLAEVLVIRQHANGNLTFGIFMVDTFCLGLKDSFYRFNMFPEDFEDLMDELFEEGYDEITYDEAHNLVYGAIAYAEEFGVEPSKSFDLTQYLLAEDDEDVPLIEYEFGKDGRPCLIADDNFEASKYLPTLKKSLGENFEFIIRDEVDEDELGFSLPEPARETTYSYQHPEYPSKLTLVHQKELSRLFESFDKFALTENEIKTILDLPRESLIADLQQIILYSLGQQERSPALIHALFFLGELRAEEALDTILEVMRQDSDAMDTFFEESHEDVLVLTLYNVGRTRLPELLAYAKEPGLYDYFKMMAFIAVDYIVNEPGRREEVLAWYSDLMKFYGENADNHSLYSPALGGMMLAEMVSFVPEELLPQIERFFKECEVEVETCGTFKEIKEDIEQNSYVAETQWNLGIHERYKRYANDWLN